MSIVDDNGQVVSMTTTVEAPFGSEMMVGGFILDNQLTDFSFEPMHDGKPVANAPAPGKHPLSSMSPTIVLGPDGRFKLAVGSPGGPMIIDYVAQALIAMLDSGLDPGQAAALPHPGNLNSPTLIEKGTVLEALAPGARRDGPHRGDAGRGEERAAYRRAREGRLCRRRRSADATAWAIGD